MPRPRHARRRGPRMVSSRSHGAVPVPPGRDRLAVPVLLVLAVVVTACTPGGEDGEAAAVGGGPTDVAATDMEPEFVADPDCFGLGPARAEQLECGTVEVPLDHDAPAEGTIELAVVVDRTADTGGAEAPLLMLGGGPGVVMVEPYLTTPEMRQVFAASGRTTIVIDQRGVGSSAPALECPELDALQVQASPAAEIDAALDATGACRERLAGQGVDLDAYNHLANARDVEMVRRALGHGQLDLRGLSYGTQVALLAAEMFPESVRSVVLSSPVDPQVNWVEDLAVGYAQALEGLATACEEDAACTDQVGDLRSAIEATVERLDGQPEQVTVASRGGETATRTYTPSRFLDDLFNFFYQAQGAEWLPAVVDRAHDGDLAPLANIVTALEQQRAGRFSTGMSNSMGCTGEAALVDAELALADVDDALIAEHWYPHIRLGEPVGAFCDRWDVEQIYDPSEISLDAEVPTLVVTGELDHVSLPQYGQQIHDALPDSYLIEVPHAVHEPLESLVQTGPCGQNIVTDFLNDPDTAPDAACAADFALQLGNPLPARFG